MAEEPDPKPSKMDERLVLPMDPEEAVQALLRADPADEKDADEDTSVDPGGAGTDKDEREARTTAEYRRILAETDPHKIEWIKPFDSADFMPGDDEPPG